MLASHWGRMIKEYALSQQSIAVLAPYSRTSSDSARPLFYIPMTRERLEQAIQVDGVEESWTAANACRLLLLTGRLSFDCQSMPLNTLKVISQTVYPC